MSETKPWWQSVTMWGSILTAVSAVLAAVGLESWAVAAAAVASVMTGRGRMTATKAIGPAPKSPRGGPLVAFIMGVALVSACASSPEQKAARKAHAIETAATLSECAVSQAVGGCAPQLAELVGCAVRSEPSCAVPRRQWAMCMAAQATGCGLAALVSVVHGAAEGPQITMIDPCGVDAAEDCVAWADQPAGLRECYAERLVRCVDAGAVE